MFLHFLDLSEITDEGNKEITDVRIWIDVLGLEMVTYEQYSSEVLDNSRHIYFQAFSLAHTSETQFRIWFLLNVSDIPRPHLDTTKYSWSPRNPVRLRRTIRRSSLPRATIPGGEMSPNVLTNLKDPAPAVNVAPRSI